MRRFNILQMYSIRWERAFSRETSRMKLKGANIRSFCTSVVAGLIGNASVSEEGIMPLGYAFGTSTRTIAKDEVYEVGGVNGLFLFQDIASYGHWHIMFKAKDTLINLSNKAFGYLKLSVSGDKLVITNSSGGSARSATLIYQNISLFAK